MTSINPNHHSVASTHDRRHADAQTLPQNPGQLYPCCEAIRGFSGTITRYRQRLKIYAVISCIWLITVFRRFH